MVEPSGIFDFWGIISNEIIGDVWLAIFIFLIAIILATVKLKIPFEVQILFIILTLSMLFSETLFPIIWVFTVMIVGLIFYWFISKALN